MRWRRLWSALIAYLLSDQARTPGLNQGFQEEQLRIASEQVKIAAEQARIAAQQRDIYRRQLWVAVIEAIFLGGTLIFAGVSANVARKTLEVSNRSYLSIERVDFSHFGASANLVIRKSGQLPATRLTLFYFRHVLPRPIKVNEGMFDVPIQPPLLGRILSNNDPLSIYQPISTEAAEEAERVKSGKEFIFTGFFIGYFDGFRKAQTWQVFEYDPKSDSFNLYASEQQ